MTAAVIPHIDADPPKRAIMPKPIEAYFRAKACIPSAPTRRTCARPRADVYSGCPRFLRPRREFRLTQNCRLHLLSGSMSSDRRCTLRP